MHQPCTAPRDRAAFILARYQRRDKRRRSRGDGEVCALEALNFVDGRRTVRAIRDALTGEFGPVSIAHVAAYLRALEHIGVLRR